MRTRQATLRTWMAIIFASGLLFAWIRSQGSLHYALIVAANSYFAWALCFLVTRTCARRFGPIVRHSSVRAMLSMLSALIIAAAVYVAWSYWRATYVVMGLNERLPYPDPALVALDLWFEARHPLSPGSTSIKLCGEWDRVRFVLGLACMALAALSGLLLGVLSNRLKAQDMSVARLFSLVLAVSGLVLLAPLMLIIAMGIRLSSLGHPLVRATGRRDDGTHFSFVEFRTNAPNSDRPTEFWRFVRKHSLHRLPALVSLLLGEISLKDFWQVSHDPTA